MLLTNSLYSQIERQKTKLASGQSFRLATSFARPLPDFIIIGAQKCGTTSLAKYLGDHPLVRRAMTKEIHYFDQNYHKGTAWYRSWFPTYKSGYITGEATPDYLFHPDIPRRLKKIAPSVKLIVLLRDPVDRAYSHYFHCVRTGKEALSFEDAIHAESKRITNELEKMLLDHSYCSKDYFFYSYLSRGIYIEQIKQWRKFFPLENFLFLDFEELVRDPKAVYDRTLRFFDLPKFDLPTYEAKNSYSKITSSSYPPMEVRTKEHLQEYFAGYNKELSDYLKRDFEWA